VLLWLVLGPFLYSVRPPGFPTERHRAGTISGRADPNLLPGILAAISGDTAALVSATTTSKFLSESEGLVIHEIYCKPRNFTISREEVQPVERKPLVEEHPPDKVIDMAVLPYIKPSSKNEE